MQEGRHDKSEATPPIDAIILFGVSGSGKSTVAQLLAPSLGAVFLEGDDYHSVGAIARMRAGVPLDDDDRWPWLETIGQAVAGLCAEGNPVVVACSALRRIYREALLIAARRPLTFVHLMIDPTSLRARMEAREGHFMPTALLTSQLQTLEPLETDEIGMEILEIGTAQQTASAIEQWLSGPRERRWK